MRGMHGTIYNHILSVFQATSHLQAMTHPLCPSQVAMASCFPRRHHSLCCHPEVPGIKENGFTFRSPDGGSPLTFVLQTPKGQLQHLGAVPTTWCDLSPHCPLVPRVKLEMNAPISWNIPCGRASPLFVAGYPYLIRRLIFGDQHGSQRNPPVNGQSTCLCVAFWGFKLPGYIETACSASVRPAAARSPIST